MPIKNYTTTVPEEKTVGEIMSLLAQKGARSIRIDYDGQNRPSGIGFVIFLKVASGDEFGVPVPFKLPCNFDGVFRAMRDEYRDTSAKYRFERNPESRQQARRTAWRIVKNWVEAQMAMVESDCAALAQVFLPYATSQTTAGGEISMYDRFLAQVSNQKALPSAPQEDANVEA